MVTISPVTVVLATLGSLAVATTVPYLVTGIEYRRRDNGLAYLLLVSGVGVWNAMIVVQLLTPEPRVKVFFLGLSVVGAVQAGLGWFLFASTASSTDQTFDQPWIYALAGILGGLDIVLAVTTPVHSFYWVGAAGGAFEFASVTPAVGYWLHTALLVALFAAGAWLFTGAWLRGTNETYSRAYGVVGLLTALVVVVGNVLVPGGFGVAAIAAAVLSTIGWLQASRGRALGRLRAMF